MPRIFLGHRADLVMSPVWGIKNRIPRRRESGTVFMVAEEISGEFGRTDRRRSVPNDSDSDSGRWELCRGYGGARGVKRLHF